MKRACVDITEECLHDLLGLRSGINVWAIVRVEDTGVFRVHLRGDALPASTECHPSQCAQLLEVKDVQVNN